MRRWRPRWLALRRLTAASSDYVPPDQVLTDAATDIFADQDWWTTSRRRTFLEARAADQPPNNLAVVLAAIEALNQGDVAAARRHARRALAQEQNFVFVQTLYRRALGIREPDLRERFCPAPFENMETAPNGAVYFCCPAWLPTPIGQLDGVSQPDAIWNSPVAQEIRRSVLEGDFRYCSRMHCPQLSGDRLPRRAEVKAPEHREVVATGRTRLPHGPRKVVLSHDRSCNLACPSCRKQLVVARKDEQARLDRLFDEVLAPMLVDARRLRVTGSGDPFGSAHFRRVLQRTGGPAFARLRLDLQTNGVLADAEAWEDLGLAGRVDSVAVSIDAARPETYALLRRHGDFERLLRNLGFLGRLRRQGEIKRLRLDCVVQAANFRELPDVVDLARGFGCDRVKLQMIRNWKTFSVDEFLDVDVGAPDHPDHGAFLEVLADARLAPPYVELWGFRRSAGVGRPASSLALGSGERSEP